jgi:response regulator of citrate/malate metabolism
MKKVILGMIAAHFLTVAVIKVTSARDAETSQQVATYGVQETSSKPEIALK